MAGDPLAKLLGAGSDADAGEDDGATDLLAAIKANDAAALKLAFQRMYESCASHAEYDDEDEEDDEEV